MTTRQAGEVLVKPIVNVLSWIATTGLLIMTASVFVAIWGSIILAFKMFITSFIVCWLTYVIVNFVIDYSEKAVTNFFTEEDLSNMTEGEFKTILKNRKR